MWDLSLSKKYSMCDAKLQTCWMWLKGLSYSLQVKGRLCLLDGDTRWIDYPASPSQEKTVTVFKDLKKRGLGISTEHKSPFMSPFMKGWAKCLGAWEREWVSWRHQMRGLLNLRPRSRSKIFGRRRWREPQAGGPVCVNVVEAGEYRKWRGNASVPLWLESGTWEAHSQESRGWMKSFECCAEQYDALLEAVGRGLCMYFFKFNY